MVKARQCPYYIEVYICTVKDHEKKLITRGYLNKISSFSFRKMLIVPFIYINIANQVSLTSIYVAPRGHFDPRFWSIFGCKTSHFFDFILVYMYVFIILYVYKICLYTKIKLDLEISMNMQFKDTIRSIVDNYLNLNVGLFGSIVCGEIFIFFLRFIFILSTMGRLLFLI